MPDSLSVVISAAGTGSRLSYGLPKSLVPICGRPLISWQLDLLAGTDVIVVAGFRAADVADYLRSEHPDVPILLNHDFHSTGTSASLVIGAQLAGDWIVSLAGDLLVAPEQLRSWVSETGPLIGVTPRTTSEPVGVAVDEAGHAREMGYEVESPFEWTSLMRLETERVRDFGRGHIFPNLLPFLPLPAAQIDCVEVDRPADLDRASEWLSPRIDEDRGIWTS